jgi:transposase
MESTAHRQSNTSGSAKTRRTALPAFYKNKVCLTQAELIELKWQGNFWKSQHAQLRKKSLILQQELDNARARIRDLKHRLYGKKSEKKGGIQSAQMVATDAPPRRPRGQQKGSLGHGRTPRPDLPVVAEQQDLAPEDKVCCLCGKAYHPLARTEDSTIIEVQVKSHIRLIQRKRYARSCTCADALPVLTAPPAPRLIPKGTVGVSVWTQVLLSKFLFSRGTYNLCREYACWGLALAPGTLTDGLKRIKPLFEPLMVEWRKKQLTEELFHNDETGWKVFEAIEGKVGYGWFLWVTQSRSVVYYCMSSSRSGDVPIEYFSGLDPQLDRVILVCDRFSGYKRLARENVRIILAFCWAHVRRDFLDAAKSRPNLEEWTFSWVKRIGRLYTLNNQRLEHWDDTRSFAHQTAVFRKSQQALEQAIEQMQTACTLELSNEALRGLQHDVLKSLRNHWQGLTVFIDAPEVPMDNNTAERRMRNPAMGRKNYYGSGSQWSAELAAMMFSLFQTLLLWKLNPHHWLYHYLNTCAENGGKAPTDLTPFIPWKMDDQQKQAFTKPLPVILTHPQSQAPPTAARSP